MTKRPNYDFTNEEIKNIAECIYQDYFNNYGITVDNLIKVIKNNFYNNGYEYAKELEDLGAYDIDSTIVEDLDCIDNELYKLNNKKQAQWVKDNNIKPILKIGDYVTYFHLGKDITEIIKDIDYKYAKYIIRIDDSSCRLVPFEKIKK